METGAQLPLGAAAPPRTALREIGSPRALSSVAFSSDGGVTWSDCGSMPLLPGAENTGVVDPYTRTIKITRPIIIGVGDQSEATEDKEWIAVGPDPARPGKRFTKLSTGLRPRILVPAKAIDPGPALSSMKTSVGAWSRTRSACASPPMAARPLATRSYRGTDAGG